MSKKIFFTVTNNLVFDQRMQRICTTLSFYNFDVVLIGRELATSEKLSNNPFKQTRLKCIFNKGILFYLEFNIRLFFFIVFKKVDIICGCDLDTLPATFLAAKLKQKKIVYDAHEYFTESPELIGRPTKQKIWTFIEKIIVPKVDAMYTVTNSIATLFREKYKIDCKVIHNYPLQTIEKTDVTTEKYILYQGAVNIGRGIPELINAMQYIDEMPLYIAGDGDIAEQIKQQIKDLKLENKVKLLGKIRPEKLKDITKHAIIGINILENLGLSYYYSLGNKTVDYIQAEIPQIIINFPEYNILNTKYNFGYSIANIKVETIKNAILELINNTELYDTLKYNCSIAKKEICWEKEALKIIEIYNKF